MVTKSFLIIIILISGIFNNNALAEVSINGTRMYIELNVQGDNGNFIHKGYATKQ